MSSIDYTIEQAAMELNVSTKSIRTYIKKGLLPAYLKSGKYFITLEGIRTFKLKKYARVEINSEDASKVTIDLNHWEGLLIRNIQLEAQNKALLEFKKDRDNLVQDRDNLAAKVGDLETLVDDLEQQLQSKRSRGFWSRLFNR